MSGNVDDSARLEWLTRVLGIVLPPSGDDALRRALLGRIRAVAANAQALPPDRRGAFVALAKDAKALADGPDLLAAETAVEQLEAFDQAPGPDTAAIAERRRALLADVAALADPAYADAEGTVALGQARDGANAALAAELPSPDQFTAAEQAIAAFGTALAATTARVTERRRVLLAEAGALADPAYADAEGTVALGQARDGANAALAAELPSPDQLTAAEQAIAAFGTALAAITARVAERRRVLLADVALLTDPPFADTAGTLALAVERDAAAAALAAAQPTPAQLIEAARAIAAFPTVVEAARVRTTGRRDALLVKVGELLNPAHGGTESLAELDVLRQKASGALVDATPTPAQLKEAEDAVAAFGVRLQAETARVTEQRRVLLEKVAALLTPAFADKAAKDALKLERDAAALALADALPLPAQLTEAARAVAAFATALEAATRRITDACHALRAKLPPLADPAGADPDEKQAMKAARDAATLALTAETPLPDDLVAAGKAIALLARLVKEASNASALASGGRPKAAAAARGALKAFKAVNGDDEITPKMIDDARQATEAAQADVDAATNDWNDAQNLPETTAEEIEQKRLAIEAADNAYNLAVPVRDAALARENAVFGQHALTAAVAHGPLSAESGRPFDDATAEQLIDAFNTDPRLAAAAVKTAGSAKHPDAVALGLAPMLGRMRDGFVSSGGTAWTDPDYARGYASDLLKMAGDIGPGYYDYLDDYLDSGEQFAIEPLGNEDAMAWAKVAQQRTVAVASALVQPDGSVDLTTGAARTAIGHALYNPKSLENATPALNAHIVKTAAFLTDGTTGPQATAVLQGMGAPEAGKGGEALVRRALGKADTDPVDANDARVAVTASMFKPLDQGPVGSCFSTAPARLVREKQPIEAMKAFAAIAGDGTYKPANGEKVPVVTNLPADEDPIMRGWEYTLATSAVRTGATQEKSEFATNLGLGLDQLKDIAVPTGPNQDKIWANKKKKLKGYVEQAFTFAYDPTWEVTDANDGSSSTGRYVVQRKSGGAEIRTKDDFIAQMTDVAVKSLNLRDPADETRVRDLVKSDAFINAVCPAKYRPWELPSGGRAPNVMKALHGPGAGRVQLLGEAAKTTPPQPEGERTREVLESFLTGLGGGTEDMVTIDTAGMHSFNALPNHPSLLALQGADATETALKVQTNLIDKGQALKNTDLSAERAAWMFDQEIATALAGQSDPALLTLIEDGARAHRPAAPTKPAALAAAIKQAMAGLHQKVAETRADAWKLDEEAGGKIVDGPALDKKKADLKKGFDGHAESSMKAAMMLDMGVPEFVIADTNWGDGKDHTFFVIAPDPTTGEPLLWKKVEPPGSLQPAGREWVDAGWIKI